MADTRDPKAPHGYDDNGEPLAPYGYKTDGTPRISNRGAKPGTRVGAPSSTAKKPSGASQKALDARRREQLVGLVDMAVVTPLGGLSGSPFLKARIGEKHATALAGDSVIIGNFAPHIADAMIEMSQTKPGMLQWLDTVEENAPYLMLMSVGIQLTKALVGNHLRPDPRLAQAGQTMLKMKAAQMAQAIEEQARAMGIPTEPVDEPEYAEAA